MSKFYKENDSSWNICGMTYPSATCKLSWIDIDDMIVTSIYDSKNIVYKGNVSGLSRKDGAAYIDKDDFINSTVEFFIKPVGGGGSSGVSSVNNRTGAVVLDKNDVGLNNVENLSITSEISKIPIATQISNGLMSAEDKKKLDTGGAGSGVTSINGRKGDVALSSSDVGLEKCNNTSDSEKPISESQRKRFKGIGRASLDGFSETPEEMRLKIPESDRIRGFMLTRSTNAGVLTEMYKSSTTIDKNWSDSNNWSTVFTNEDKNVANGYAGLDAAKKLANDLIRTDFRMSQGYIFDGVDDYLTVAHNDKMNFGTGDFSIQCVFTASPSANIERIFSKFKTTTPYVGYELAKSAGNQLVFVITKENGVRVNIPISGLITKKETINLVATYDNDMHRIYRNGLLINVADDFDPTFSSTDNTSNIIISKSIVANTEYFNGTVNLFRLFNRALSQQDVTYYENNGRPDLQRLQYADAECRATKFFTNETSTFYPNSAGSGTSVLMSDEAEPYYRATPNTDKIVSIYKPIIGEVPYKGLRFDLYVRQNSGVNRQLLAYGADYMINTPTLTSGIWTKVSNRTTLRDAYASVALGEPNIPIDYKLLNAYNDGCVLELLPENALPDRWLESQNGLDAITVGSPAINTETIVTDTQIVDNVTNNIAVGVTNRDYILPAGYMVDTVCIKSTVSLTALQLVNVTTSETLLTGKTVSSTAGKHLPITTDQSSSVTDTTLRLNATGNGGSGFNIVINIKKCI